MITNDRFGTVAGFSSTFRFLLIIAFTFVVAMELEAQESKTISLQAQQIRISEALSQLEGLTGYKFFYEAGVVDPAMKLDISLENAPLDKALNQICSTLSLAWEIQDRFIILRRKASPSAQIQPVMLKGRIVDESGAPLPGATIYIKGTNTGTTSDLNGQFELSVPAEGATVVFRFVGMKEQEVFVKDQQSIEIVMTTEVIGLDEVISIGYGVQKKRDLTGAVSVVNVDEMRKLKVTGIGEALQGQLSGVSVITSGDPGSMAEVRVRGIGSFSNVGPLYVIDGLILNDANHINVSDIESIQVLKDASSAAIYGARGANGVI
ncbi:MAG: TonB-dependent receptor plug domain-containing protein, partial [Bacteroidales bacterium]|nr:TonB-dependent receptor plug domain-containing protein [Bacteroidales bacterium]